MNRTIATVLLTAGVFATLGVSSLNAQERGVADVPFAFHVKSRLMPAGKYEVSSTSNSDKCLLSITDSKGHTGFVLTVPSGSANPEQPKLTFGCYAGDCTLVKMDLPGSAYALS